MKQAVILLNMGGPNHLGEVGLFLHNMFNDPNIITVKSSLLRRFIAFMITTTRTKKAEANYAKLGGKSPLVGYTKRLIAALQRALPDIEVAFAMRYTPPFCDSVIADLKAKGVDEVLLLPLYPHYSTTTTKSSLEDFEAIAKALDFHPKVHTIERFYEERLYNESVAQTIIDALGEEDPRDIELIFSAHSLPKKIVAQGDPYQKEVTLHVALLSRLLEEKGIHFRGIHLAYQSKLGPLPWLDPSLEETLRGLEHKNVLICPISFTLDNSETEFELSIEYAEVAHELNYKGYRVARCPNDSLLFVKCLQAMVRPYFPEPKV